MAQSVPGSHGGGLVRADPVYSCQVVGREGRAIELRDGVVDRAVNASFPAAGLQTRPGRNVGTTNLLRSDLQAPVELGDAGRALEIQIVV
jgi:hypothetical protein